MEFELLVCHCHQQFCHNQRNGTGCIIGCKDPDGVRYPLVEKNDGSLGLMCTCPVCKCKCCSVVKKHHTEEIKLAQLLTSQKQGNIVTPVPIISSKVNESREMVKNMLKHSFDQVDADENSGNILNVKSKLSKKQETAMENANADLAQALHNHPEYAADFRQKIECQVLSKNVLMIERNGQFENVRALHNGNVWKHRVQNNDLNRSIIQKIENSNKENCVLSSNPSNSLGSLDDDHKTSSTIQVNTNSGASEVNAIELLDDTIGNDNLCFDDSFDESNNDYDHSNETANENISNNQRFKSADSLYVDIQRFCFTNRYCEDESNAYVYKQVFTHLTQNRNKCNTCLQVCEQLLQSTREDIQMTIAVNTILDFFEFHIDVKIH